MALRAYRWHSSYLFYNILLQYFKKNSLPNKKLDVTYFVNKVAINPARKHKLLQNVLNKTSIIRILVHTSYKTFVKHFVNA